MSWIMSWCPMGGVQSEAELSERSTWGRRWPRRSPQVESLARVRASHSKSGPPQRNVPSVLGWCRSLYRCSTRGDGTCPSALPPSPWSSRDMKITLNLSYTKISFLRCAHCTLHGQKYLDTWTLHTHILCTGSLCHVETQTAATKLEEHYCPKRHFKL